jgi:hypothetical protein
LLDWEEDNYSKCSPEERRFPEKISGEDFRRRFPENLLDKSKTRPAKRPGKQAD